MIKEIISQTEWVEISLRLPNGKRLAGKRWGSLTTPESTKIIALHGWLDNASTWDKIAPELAKKGAVFIALEFLGHGKSDHQDNYTTLLYTSSTISAIKVIGWDKFTLIGHSMGAAVATFVAAVIPENIESLILIEGFGEFPTQLNSLEVLRQGIEFRSKQFFDRQPKVYPDIKSAIRKLRENNANLAELSASLIVLRSLIKVEDGYSFSHDPRLVAPSIFRFNETDNKHFILGIKCPVLMFWTRKSSDLNESRKIFDSSTQQIYQERVKLLNPATSQVILLEEGSHHVHLDRPDLVLPHIEKFFEKYLQNPSEKARL